MRPLVVLAFAFILTGCSSSPPSSSTTATPPTPSASYDPAAFYMKQFCSDLAAYRAQVPSVAVYAKFGQTFSDDAAGLRTAGDSADSENVLSVALAMTNVVAGTGTALDVNSTLARVPHCP